MFAALDVSYDEQRGTAKAAAVVFRCWDDAQPLAEYTVEFPQIEPYVSGEFFRRELPCLLGALEKIQQSVDTIIIDGYVMLGRRPGLGMYLWRATGKKYAIVGIAKSRFHHSAAVEVVRGESNRPLYVTAVGMEAAAAAEYLRRMHGDFRVPTLLQRVDELTRESSPSSGHGRR